MMRHHTCLILFLIVCWMGCQSPQDSPKALQNRIDSLETKMAHMYTPGLGEMMLTIQMRHAKLWFAGQHENWPLANFETEEIRETAGDIKQYLVESEETKTIETIFPALDSLEASIKRKDLSSFNRRYQELTQTCNACHHENNHPFNVIRIPDAPPFSNQDFNPELK